MSDIKYCPSCGTTLSVLAGFCHNCGQKQKITGPETVVPTDVLVSESGDQTSIEKEELSIETSPLEVKNDENDIYPTAPEAEPKVPAPPVIKFEEKQQVVMSTPVTPVSIPELAKPLPTLQQQPVYYPQNPMPQQVDEKKIPKKNKFPWFFTVLWFILFSAVGVWAYYLYTLVSAGGDFPEFTEDAQRILLFAGSISLLIYTLSLKLSMKKFRAFPTIILVIAVLVIFYLFSMVELTDGDWLHDTVSNITNSIIQTSGQ